MADADPGKQRALLAAGAVGGPFTICVYTPLRNAITLGAKDAETSAAALYRLTFARGLAGGWTGWLSPTVFSSAQFLALGPLYHVYASAVGPTLAIVPTALTESTISFGSQARNAQMAYNATVEAARHVPLQQPWDPRGAGFPAHVLRNGCAMSGIRALTHPVRVALESASEAAGGGIDAGTVAVAADFASSILSAALSMPFNQLFNFLVTTPKEARPEGLVAACAGFLRSQYLVRSPTGTLRLRATALRDVFMRCAYIAPQLSTFSAIERLCVSMAAGRWTASSVDG